MRFHRVGNNLESDDSPYRILVQEAPGQWQYRPQVKDSDGVWVDLAVWQSTEHAAVAVCRNHRKGMVRV